MANRLPLLGLTPDKPVVPTTELADALDATFLAFGLSRKLACARMGIDEGQWSRALSSGNVPLGKVLALGPAFWKVLNEQLAQRLWPEPAEDRAVLAMDVLTAVNRLVVTFLAPADADAERRSA